MSSDTPEVERAEAAKAADLAQGLLTSFHEIRKEVTPPHSAGWLERVEAQLAAAKAAIDEIEPYPYKSAADTSFSREWARMLLDRDIDILATFAIKSSLYAMGGSQDAPDIRRTLLCLGIDVSDLLCSARQTLGYSRPQQPRSADDDGNADPALGA